MTLRAGVIVVLAPLANPARLATATISDLALCRLHTHGLEWASNWIGGALRAVIALVALSKCGVRHSVQASTADIAGNTFVNLLSCAAIVCLTAGDALIEIRRRLRRISC